MQSANAAPDVKSSDVGSTNNSLGIDKYDEYCLANMKDLSLIKTYLQNGGDPNIHNASGIPLIFTALSMALEKNPLALDYLKCFRGTKVNVNVMYNYFDDKYHKKLNSDEDYAKAGEIAKKGSDEWRMNAVIVINAIKNHKLIPSTVARIKRTWRTIIEKAVLHLNRSSRFNAELLGW